MKDPIERQAAIDAIEHRLAEPAYQHTGEDWYVGMNCAESELYDLPSVQSEQQWIPCSERLPEEDTYVLATTAWGEITMAEKLSDIAWFICEGNANAKSDDIVAWLPLPKPYKGR